MEADISPRRDRSTRRDSSSEHLCDTNMSEVSQSFVLNECKVSSPSRYIHSDKSAKQDKSVTMQMNM